MDEFNNRIDVQRKTLSIVNSRVMNEPLNGISKAAIDRWSKANGIPETHPIVKGLISIAEGIFFLSNKSQQQITDEYRSKSLDIENLLTALTRVWN